MTRFIQLLAHPLSVAFLVFSIAATSKAEEDFWFGDQITDNTNNWKSYVAVTTSNLDSNEIEIVRNYNAEINLGVDPVSGVEWYPHRSVKVKYMTDCENEKVAMQSWKLYTKQNARGDVVWADEDFAIPHYYKPMIKDERIALENVCELIQTAKK